MQNTSALLFAAIFDDDRAAAKELLNLDIDLAKHAVAEDERFLPNITHWIYAGDTALHAAAAGYRVEIAQMLLAGGTGILWARNRRGSLPLHYAADGHSESPSWSPGRQVAMVRLLLEAGSPIDTQDKNGATSLHRAVRTRCAEAVKCLLNAGADPAIRNKAGSTPFHLAVQNTGRGGSGSEMARRSQCEIIRAFLDRGISPALIDCKGKSVLEWARSDWIRQLLEASLA